MTVSPTPPAPIKPTAGGSFATLLPDYNALAADASGQYGYGTKKIINGIATDKASQLAKFRQNIRTSANQSEYQNNVEILKRLGLVSGKSPSRTSVDTGYDALLTDFYLSPDKDFSTYISTRLTTAQTKGIGTSTTTSRQQSTSAEAAQIITDAFKGYLNIIPNASTITSFTKDLINLEKKLSARTTTTRDAAGNATTTTVGGVATKEDREALALNYVSKILGKQEGIVNAGPTLAAGLTAIRKFANDYGVVVPDADIRGYAMQYVRDGKLDFITEKLKNISKARYPGLTQYIDQGLSVKDVASQYMVRKAQLLEVPIETLNPFDTDVSRAISGQVMETIGDFDNRMRQSPLWQYTKNAKEKGASFVNNILSKFGMV
jgi:hypothetical protein